MPWHIEEADGEYCVIKDSDDAVEGCHDTREDAEDQMAALYASEAERVGLIDWVRLRIQAVFSPFLNREWSGDASNYDSTAAYCSACLIDVNAAAGNDEKTQSHCMLPVKSPGSDSINWEGIQAAAGGHGIQAVKKPEGVSSEDWDSARKSAANKIISEYNDHDETAPDAVYEIAGKEPPEERMSDRVVSLEMAFDQIYERLWSDEELSSSWIHDLYLSGDGSPFLILSQRGKLYRVALAVSGDTVSMGDMEPVEIEFKPTDRAATKTIVREVEPGVFRWFSISATSVLNKDGEIDSQALFDTFVERIDRTEEYPVRRFHHVDHPKFVIGQTDFVARDEHTLITSGLYNDSLLAQLEVKARMENPDEWGESIGYLPTAPPEMVDVSGVEIPTYNEGVLREISTVRQENACSWFTTTVLTEEVKRIMNERARGALLALFDGDEEAMGQFLGSIELTNREIDAGGLISREETPEEEPQATEEDPVEREPHEVILEEEAMSAIVERFSEAVAPLRAQVEALETRIQAIEDSSQSAFDEAGEALESLVERLEALEQDEDERRQEWLEDASPRMRRTTVSYRPRVERDGDEEEESEPVSEMEVAAGETLSALPA